MYVTNRENCSDESNISGNILYFIDRKRLYSTCRRIRFTTRWCLAIKSLASWDLNLQSCCYTKMAIYFSTCLNSVFDIEMERWILQSFAKEHGLPDIDLGISNVREHEKFVADRAQYERLIASSCNFATPIFSHHLNEIISLQRLLQKYRYPARPRAARDLPAGPERRPGPAHPGPQSIYRTCAAK